MAWRGKRSDDESDDAEAGQPGGAGGKFTSDPGCTKVRLALAVVLCWCLFIAYRWYLHYERELFAHQAGVVALDARVSEVQAALEGCRAEAAAARAEGAGAGEQSEVARLRADVERVSADHALVSAQLEQAHREAQEVQAGAISAPRTEEFVQRIQHSELAALKIKYGKGPAKIRMQTDRGTIVLQTAPFELMPHTVHYFLQLVEAGFFNGCGFVRNADHVMQANCSPRDDPNPRPRVMFQEYSDQYTHLAYRLGMAGFPAEVDFYINLVENVVNHGPGGQGPEANPCFAEVLLKEEDSQATLDAIHALPEDGTGFQGLLTNVLFTSVTVMR